MAPTTSRPGRPAARIELVLLFGLDVADLQSVPFLGIWPPVERGSRSEPRHAGVPGPDDDTSARVLDGVETVNHDPAPTGHGHPAAGR